MEVDLMQYALKFRMCAATTCAIVVAENGE